MINKILLVSTMIVSVLSHNIALPVENGEEVFEEGILEETLTENNLEENLDDEILEENEEVLEENLDDEILEENEGVLEENTDEETIDEEEVINIENINDENLESSDLNQVENVEINNVVEGEELVSMTNSTRNFTDYSIVGSEEELLNEINNLSEIPGDTKTIEISQDIALTQDIFIQLSKNVVISSNSNATLTSAVGKPHFRVAQSDGGNTLTLNNFTLIGSVEAEYIQGDELIGDITQASAGGGIAGTTSGKLIIEGMVFKYIKEKAVNINSKGGVLIRNSSFVANTSAIEGTVIRVQGDKEAYVIENSTFINNKGNCGTWMNYANPVIYMNNSNVEVILKNNTFVNNYTYVKGTNSSATGGGVLTIKQSSSNVLVEGNYFYGNEVEASIGRGNGNGTTADGGAIYSFWSTGKMEVIGNTFHQNVANDEGGAISIVASNNEGNLIANNTFIENRSRGRQVSNSWGVGTDGDDGGGAIEVNGNETNFGYAKIANNTFYANVAENGMAFSGDTVLNQGGAISFRYANGVVANNVIVGNEAGTEETKNIYVDPANTDVTLSNNVIDEAVMDVFYTDGPTLGEFDNTVLAGNPNEGYEQIIPVLMPIGPNNNSSATGLADGQGIDTEELDQRNYTRTVLPDIGALDTIYVEFNSNGGSWSKDSGTLFYDGSLFYSADDEGIVEEQLIVTYPSSSIEEVIEDPTAPEGYQFIGWHDAADSTSVLSEEELRNKLSELNENVVLYAIYEEVIVSTPEETVYYTLNFMNCSNGIAGQDWVQPGENGTPPYGFTYERSEYINVGGSRDIYPKNCDGGFKIPDTGK